jgi:hypothetical protein
MCVAAFAAPRPLIGSEASKLGRVQGAWGQLESRWPVFLNMVLYAPINSAKPALLGADPPPTYSETSFTQAPAPTHDEPGAE